MIYGKRLGPFAVIWLDPWTGRRGFDFEVTVGRRIYAFEVGFGRGVRFGTGSA